MNLNELGDEIIVINKNNGCNIVNKNDWNDNYRIPTALALIHTEASEAVEAFRNNDYDNFIEELSDVIIRTLDLARGMDINIDEAVLNKLNKNKKRSNKHGGKGV